MYIRPSLLYGCYAFSLLLVAVIPPFGPWWFVGGMGCAAAAVWLWRHGD